MKNVVTLLAALIMLMAFNQYLIADKIAEVRQDIVEIKKDFSYDPKDAK